MKTFSENKYGIYTAFILNKGFYINKLFEQFNIGASVYKWLKINIFFILERF